jgi:hypothetical protein
MFRVNQQVVVLITRADGEVVRLDTVLAVMPGRMGAWEWKDVVSGVTVPVLQAIYPPTMRLTNSPTRLYNALTGTQMGGYDSAGTTRVVAVEEA